MKAFFNRLRCFIYGHIPFLFNDKAAYVTESNNGYFKLWGPLPTFGFITFRNDADDYEVGLGYCTRCCDSIWIVRKHPKEHGK